MFLDIATVKKASIITIIRELTKPNLSLILDDLSEIFLKQKMIWLNQHVNYLFIESS